MPVGRREENSQRTKAAIVTSALRLFAERGYDNVTIESITRAAGVAKGTYYSYFSVKSDIIVEEFWKIDRFYGEWTRRNLHRFPAAPEKLRAFTRAQMRYVRDNVGNQNLKLLYANQTLLSGKGKVIVDPQREWYRIVAQIIAEGQGAGIFRTDQSADELARGFNRSMRAVFLDWCILDGSFDLVRGGLEHLERWSLPALAAAPGVPSPSRG